MSNNLKFPRFRIGDSAMFEGYRFRTPETASFPTRIIENLRSVKLEQKFLSNPIWSRMLKHKLETMLGFPTTAPLPKEHSLSFFLFQYGESFLGPPIKLRLTLGQCHLNSSQLWNQNQRQLELVRGFVMRKDEWFVHSWCVPKLERQVIETSQVMDFYWGFRYPNRMARHIATEEGRLAREQTTRPSPRYVSRTTRLGTKLRLILPPTLRSSAEWETSLV